MMMSYMFEIRSLYVTLAENKFPEPWFLRISLSDVKPCSRFIFTRDAQLTPLAYHQCSHRFLHRQMVYATATM